MKHNKTPSREHVEEPMEVAFIVLILWGIVVVVVVVVAVVVVVVVVSYSNTRFSSN